MTHQPAASDSSAAAPSTGAASAWYEPGERWLVVARRSMVVSEGTAAEALGIWRAVTSGAGAGDLLLSCVRGSLTSEQWSAPGAFAIAVAEEAGTRVLVRGIEDVTVLDADGRRAIVAGADLLTWTEVLVPDAVEVRIGDVEGVVLPVPVGVVRARALRWNVPDPSAGHGDPEFGGTVVAAGIGDGPETMAETVDGAGSMVKAVDDAGPMAGPIDAAGSMAGPINGTGTIDPAGDGPPGDEVVGPAGEHQVPAAGSQRSLEETRGDLDPDELQRLILPVPVAAPAAVPIPVAIRSPEQGPLSNRPAPPAAIPPPVDDRPSVDGAPAATDPLPVGAVVQRSDPAAPGPLAAIPEFADAAGPEGDHDGLTQLAEDLPVGYTPPPMPAAPVPGYVLAALCPAGHPNAPHSRSCRLCGQLIVQGEPVPVPRPVLARIRLSTGEVIDVDRAIVIGRSPYVSRVAAADLPRLVAVPSPNQDISRAHAEIRPEDWHLVVADLDSTNGTTVRAPGRAPQRLRPAQEVVVEPGWTVELADGVSFVVEAV